MWTHLYTNWRTGPYLFPGVEEKQPFFDRPEKNQRLDRQKEKNRALFLYISTRNWFLTHHVCTFFELSSPLTTFNFTLSIITITIITQISQGAGVYSRLQTVTSCGVNWSLSLRTIPCTVCGSLKDAIHWEDRFTLCGQIDLQRNATTGSMPILTTYLNHYYLLGVSRLSEISTFHNLIKMIC